MTPAASVPVPVTVLLFARVAEAAGADRLAVAVPPPATVGALLEHLSEEFPAWGPLAARCLTAVNAGYADVGTALRAGDEVAVIPPVSGG